jgi:hypothetical protein
MVYYICRLKNTHKLVSPEGLEILWLTKDKMKKVVHDEDYIERMFNWRGHKNPSFYYRG